MIVLNLFCHTFSFWFGMMRWVKHMGERVCQREMRGWGPGAFPFSFEKEFAVVYGPADFR